MQIGKIVGCVVATMKDPGLAAQRLLIVQPLTPELNIAGKQLICTDSTGAGAGELVSSSSFFSRKVGETEDESDFVYAAKSARMAGSGFSSVLPTYSTGLEVSRANS